MKPLKNSCRIVPVTIPRRKGDPVKVEKDEHLRPDTTLEALAKLPADQQDKQD